jgi:two-component system, OmpR family, alkaline phosphatase synthesis response regulator PhoP
MTAATLNSSPLTQTRILVAEDDPAVAESLNLYLQLFSCEVDIASDGCEALERAVAGRYDLIVLDLSLPKMDGLLVCQAIRRQQVLTPILMLTARASEGDKVVGLGAGADDYMTKPFSSIELQARLSALLRRSVEYRGQPETRLEFGELVIAVDRRAVRVGNRDVNLTAKEFDLLVALARYPGRVYSRAQLLDGVWGYAHNGYEHTVNSHINRLRAKLEANPMSPAYVLTVRGVGYRFREQ